ncbi:Hypothetical protein FKW44_002063 [Caligus rogercresseyi]|uniref:Uncharacterized protein n=1 Tax=Caligus rogercresseyi TaxID=217165 RepID=A0A7T8KJP4_CALRO|nr:Hypothetical protein FKW44_002063 [Caligus rogercresseyi]
MEETREEACSLTAFKASTFCHQDPKMWFDILEIMFKSNDIKKSGQDSHTQQGCCRRTSSARSPTSSPDLEIRTLPTKS